MSEVNLNLKFQATNTNTLDSITAKVDKLEASLRKGFKLELDTKAFTENLNTLQSTLNRLGKDTQLVNNMKSIAGAFNSLSDAKLNTAKIKEFTDNLKSLSAKDIKDIAGSLHSVANALTKMNGTKPPSMTAFINSINKLSSVNVDTEKMGKMFKIISSFKDITISISGTKDLNALIGSLTRMNNVGLDTAVLLKFKKMLEALSGINANINIRGLSNIPTFVKNMSALDSIRLNETEFLNKMKTVMKGLQYFNGSDLNMRLNGIQNIPRFVQGMADLDKVRLNEQNFLKKMQTIAKGFEVLSKANIDIEKMRIMADAMRSIADASRGAGGNGGGGGFGGMGGLAGLATGWLSMGEINNQVEQAKQLEYAILQVGVAGELSSEQMRTLKQDMFDMSNQSGKSALEITQAMEAIIKTGQSLSDSKYILDTAIKTSVASGKVFALHNRDIMSKVA